MTAVLTAKHLKKTYPGKNTSFLAVDDVSFELNEGEILGLLGPNGSGKTTTIQMLLGTLSPTAGEISYFGKDFSKHRSEILQHVSFASTYTQLPVLLTVEENLEVFGRLYGLSPKIIREKTEPLLKQLGIFEKRKSRTGSLSAGQMTRLMLVKAFFIEPKVILLDEPTASLDPDMAQEICRLLLELRKKRGLSILFTSHKMQEATELCDRVIFLKNGRVLANDTPKNLAKKAAAFRLRLVLLDGLKRTEALAKERGFTYTIDHRSIEISLDEKEISLFLNAIAKMDITYANIQIKEPSLDDYFLQIARN